MKKVALPPLWCCTEHRVNCLSKPARPKPGPDTLAGFQEPPAPRPPELQAWVDTCTEEGTHLGSRRAALRWCR